jgi:hypothetical protein
MAEIANSMPAGVLMPSGGLLGVRENFKIGLLKMAPVITTSVQQYVV